MRASKALLLLVVLTALGAVLGYRLGPERRPAGLPPSSVAATGPSAAAPALRTVRPTPMVVTVRDARGHVVLAARVGAMDPVRAASGFAPVNPPRWKQAVWVRYRPLVPPTDTARGTAYLYGHACHHHDCAFTALASAVRGDTIEVTGGGTDALYRITSTSADYPKSGVGSLAERRDGVANRSIRNRLVLITCAYEQGDVSLNDFVVVARRV